MKQWNITVTAKNERDAAKLLEYLSNSFDLAVTINEPLHHAYADMGRSSTNSSIVCDENKNFKG